MANILLLLLPSSSVLLLVLCFPGITFSATFTQLRLPTGAFGPYSLAFEYPGGPFYVGVADGTIRRYGGPGLGWSTYAIISPNWSVNACSDNTDPNKGPICGRPTGLVFNLRTRKLYVVDVYYGFAVVNPDDGFQAQLIANSEEGLPFKAPTGLDIDPSTEHVFFTDVSAVYEPRNASQAFLNNDATGRLMRYDPATNRISVLMRNLSGASGVAVSSDGSYLLVSEIIANRTRRFWLRGARANTSEIFMTQIRWPNNIKRGLGNEFWMVATSVTGQPIGLRVDGSRRILETIYLQQYGYSTYVAEVQQSGVAGLYIASLFTDFIGRVNLIKHLN